MKTFEVWSEGFRVTGQNGTATFEGKTKAKTFEDACEKILGDRLNTETYDTPTVWGCRCFDNEEDARKSFG